MGVAADATLERLRVFVASPGDVAAEREHVKTVADELNRGVAAQAGFVLEVVRWEAHARPDMGRTQQLPTCSSTRNLRSPTPDGPTTTSDRPRDTLAGTAFPEPGMLSLLEGL